MNCLKKKTSLIIALFFCFIGLSKAQTGDIKGLIIDSEDNNPIPGATVRITEGSQSIATNNNGSFELYKLNPGTYTLEVTSLSYQTLLIRDVKIEADKTLALNLTLKSSQGEHLDEVVVTVSQLRNTNNAVLSEMRGAKQVVSGISQQQIKLSQDRDAAQVMSRIPGLTIVDNRFVMVRGIPERYNQVMLNNAIAPSTEVDKRTFSFDLIPSSVLEKMMIYKSGSPENPGDFAGGLIKVYTNSATGENFTTFSAGSNFRANTTFEPYIYNRTSDIDFLGFDGGERGLPNTFPTENMIELSARSPIRIEAPKLLNNDLSYKNQHAIPDFNFSLGLGRSWNTITGKRISMLSSVNYSQSNQFYARNFNRYEIQDPKDYGTPAPRRLLFLDNHYEKENRIGILTNWALTLNPYHKLEFKNLFNQIGENSSILRSGRDFVQQGDLDRKNYLYEYRSRSIYSGQLEGTHRFQGGRTSLNWIVGSNYLSENQPDLKRFRTTQQAPGSVVFRMEMPSSSNLYDTGRFFGKLSETGLNNSTNLERQLGGTGEDPILLKVGYLVD
ncbi:MAG TPA: TonB-dependent receptor, partial [Sphingobacterium sp.]|nr:TonB-dependent receptor [Sphingobacterium sp.]